MDDQSEMSGLANVAFGSFLGCVPLPRQRGSSYRNTLSQLTYEPHLPDIASHGCAVNPRTGEVSINGPMTEEEQISWDHLRTMKNNFLEAISECKVELADPHCQYREQIQDELDHSLRMVSIISKVIKE